MKFLTEYKPKKQPILTYTRVTKKAMVDHEKRRIHLREDQHIFELTLPNMVAGIRDTVGKAINRLCDRFYDAMGRLFVPTCYPV